MTTKLFNEWLISLNSDMKREKRHILLFLDNCTVHNNAPPLSNVKLQFFPPNSTPKLQPLDLGIIQNFKTFYRREVVKSVLDNLENQQNLTTISILTALIMIDKAWRAVTPLTIHCCFKKSGFPSPNLVDVDDTLTEFNAEPSLWEALPEQDLTFDDYVLFDMDIAVWIPIIKGKNSTVIRAYLDADKNIIFSDEIAPFHHICSIFKTDVERWLQTMLEWDPKKRGKYESGSAFNLLETMFQKKISHVFCVDTLTLHSFIINETMSLEDFYKELEKETKIPVSQQEIFSPDGHSSELKEGVSQFVSDMEEEETIVFLFNKNESQSSMITSSSTVIPSDVENMMRNPHDKVNYQQQRNIWSQAVYLSQQESSLINKLIQAFKANLMSLLTKASYVRKSISRMTAEMNKLLAKCSLFKSSLEQDIKSYEKQSQNGGFSAETLLEDWKSNFENLKKVDILRQKIVNLEACTSNIATRTAELQKSPYVRSKQSTSFEDVHQKILNSFAELRKRSSDERRIPHDNVEIVRLLCLCLQHSHTLTEDVIIHIKIVKQIKRDIDDCLPQIGNLLKEISDWEFQIDSWQSKRQQALWKVINALIEKAQHAERSISPLVLSSSPQTLPKRQINNFGLASLSKTNPDLGMKSLHESSKLSTILKTPPIITPPAWQNRLESLTLSSSLSNGEGSVSKMRFNPSYMSNSILSLSEILDKTAEDSRRVKKENENLMESFQSMMEILKSYPGVNNHEEET
ncbi:inhibitor of nuclear factor kappa-B kinase subunit alpha [Trichonephila clavipes]|nr:inhibitor of nuclear factor kappa-B kinase subunit alpha [Trichonephila clavipes]